MIRILQTGDLHLGRTYDANHNPEIADKYSKARIEALHNVIRVADEKECDYIVICGDLFDKKTVDGELIKKTCSILGGSPCRVIVIPGNHDYYDGPGDELWNKFSDYRDENTILLTSGTKRIEDNIAFYPCICHDKTSEDNAIGWVKEDTGRDHSMVNIGLAHGAIEGLSYDKEKKYYYMTRDELEGCGMDLWLIGHTHIPFPAGEKIENQRIFNAGTHQQTDISDNSEGSVFVITVDDDKKITCEKVPTGELHFCKKEIKLKHGSSLREELEKSISGIGFDEGKTSVRVEISGIANVDEFAEKEEIYDDFRNRCFLDFDVRDSSLEKEITEEMIDSETVEGSIENKLLKKYIGEPEMLNIAYDLIKRCKEGK